MRKPELHSFHIPVMGLAFTVDTPVKVAHFGISSVISIMDDELLERMREFYSKQAGEEFIPIPANNPDIRADLTTAYLNLLHKLIKHRTEALRALPFEPGNDLTKYFELLPDNSPVKKKYEEMLQVDDSGARKALQEELRTKIEAGAIDVNIMSKVDKPGYAKSGELLPKEFSLASCALRGFAKSDLNSSVVFSAGYNPRLYSYLENFSDFFPNAQGQLKKKIILKVSDYRSAVIQGKQLAKKGLWVSEFRIESGLNCGGHAFATDGLLLGPILEEFKKNRAELAAEMLTMCNSALNNKAQALFPVAPQLKITVQGGIGTANENNFLLDYYEADSTGWGSPFLLVPEVTNVDDETIQRLATAKKEDYYLSHASPLGIPFNNLKDSSSERQRMKRIEKGRPGSPCYKKILTANTEFTQIPICSASREYQNLKIAQLKEKNLSPEQLEAEIKVVLEKDCLCEGLGSPALLKNKLPLSHHLSAVTICPGPNLAYFSGTFTLRQMVDHIYGRTNLLNATPRSNMFVNELRLYVTYLKNEYQKPKSIPVENNDRYLKTFQANLLTGISYYKNVLPFNKYETQRSLDEMHAELEEIEKDIKNLSIPNEAVTI